jgi:hypothetical protein
MRRSVAAVALACVSGAAMLFAASFIAGVISAPQSADPDPVRLEHGLPVGVVRSPEGALAAAANDVAIEHRTSATDPVAFEQLIRVAWVRGAGARELGLERRARALAPAPVGLRLLSGVAAGRIEHYAHGSAVVALWCVSTYWSAAIAPTQKWSLDTLTLRWTAGRWRVSAHTATGAPVPQWAAAAAGNDTAAAFNAGLAGMTAPTYGGTAW